MASFFSGCAKKRETSSAYTISGYVYDEYGLPVEGVTVTSDFGDALTDKDGKYTFANIEGSIVLSPSIKGYQFEETSKYVKNQYDDANFVAYKEYTVSGTAHNNQVAVPNANIKLSSLAGEFYTMTDEQGKFVVSGVAGRTNISCEVDGVEFYSTSASLDAPNVSISTTSSLTIKVASDDQIDLSKVELWLNGSKLLFADSQKVIENVKCGSTVEIRSSYYHFDKPSTFVVDELNQVESFNLNRIYSLSGSVVSGSVPISNANIFVDGKLASQTNESGLFELDGLWAEREISAEYAGFEFNKDTANFDNNTIVLSGTKEITLDLVLDFGDGEDITVSNSTAKREDEDFVIQKVCLGETVVVTSSKYYFATNSVVVDDDNNYRLEGQKFYALEIQGLEDVLDYDVYLDGELASFGELQSLYGSHEISVRNGSYIFSSASVNAENSIARISYKIPYTAAFKVVSGELLLSGAKIEVYSLCEDWGAEPQGITIGGKPSFKRLSATTNEEGVASLENLFIGDSINISKDGYYTAITSFDGETSIEKSLSYGISGVVLTGTEFVEQAKVVAGGNEVLTDANGEFEIFGLSGEIEVVVSKEGFEFDTLEVSSNNDDIEIKGNYSISGKLEVEDAQNYKVVILNTSTATPQEVGVAEDGTYQLANLEGKYLVYVVDANDTNALNPVSYTVRGSSVCNFSSSGFSVEGCVKTGDVAISYAKVTAGALSVYTDADGYYKFELLTEACEISVTKAGYVFSDAVLVEGAEDDEPVEVNFTATYSVSGRVAFGRDYLSDVKVYVSGNAEPAVVSGENGTFEISGLSGSKTLTFEKAGYVFESTVNVSGYQSNIAVSSKIIVSIVVASGSNPILGADYYVNGEKIGTAASHEITLTLSYGDVVSFEKAGFDIADVTVSNQSSYAPVSAYMISATVVSGTEKVTGFEVYLNGNVTKDIVVSGNTFTISGLVGENKITIQKTGYAFEEQTISSNQALTFNGTFAISGNVFVGSKKLEGVVVTAGGKQATTDAEGYYEISGLSGKVSVSASKTGYGFDSYANKLGSQTITFDASYSLAGIVKSGSLALSVVDISVVADGVAEILTTKTDTNGNFVVSGIRGNANIIIAKDGYNAATLEGYNDYVSNITANLTYSYTVSFDFAALNGKVENITLYLNDEARVVVGGSLKLTNLSGVNTIRFEAASRKFSISSQEIKQPGSISVGVYPSYNVEGYVKAAMGHAIANIKVANESGAYCMTDANGYYKLDDIAGTIFISDSSITRENKTVESNGRYDFTVSNADFSFMLYNNANKKLDGASSVQIIGDGTVVGVTSMMTTTQYVHAVVKRDQNGNVIRQNLNYGETVNAVIIKVDPKVSLVAVGTNNGGSMSWEYQILRESANVVDKTTANHTTSGLTAITASAFQSTYGSYPDAYSSYVINSSTASVSSINYDSGSQVYTIVFRSPMSSQTGYQKQIVQLAPSGTTYLQNSNSYCQLTVQISKAGWIKQVDAHDEYKINQTMEVSVTSDVKYVYHTDKSNYHISGITRNNINESLKWSTQTEVATYGSARRYDIVSKTIYGI